MLAQDHAALEHEIWIAARPETVFPFFTDPVKLVEWKGVNATLVAKNGGVYRVNLNGRDIIRGEYLEVTPFRRVVFTWGWEGANSPLPPGASTVEVNLIADGKGTRVRLRHNGLPDGPVRQQHRQGWDHYLARLQAVAQGQDPGPDPLATPADPASS